MEPVVSPIGATLTFLYRYLIFWI